MLSSLDKFSSDYIVGLLSTPSAMHWASGLVIIPPCLEEGESGHCTSDLAAILSLDYAGLLPLDNLALAHLTTPHPLSSQEPSWRKALLM